MQWGLSRKYRHWSLRELLLTRPRNLRFKYRNKSGCCCHKTRRHDFLQRCEKWAAHHYLICAFPGVHNINCQRYWQAQEINRPLDWSSQYNLLQPTPSKLRGLHWENQNYISSVVLRCVYSVKRALYLILLDLSGILYCKSFEWKRKQCEERYVITALMRSLI